MKNKKQIKKKGHFDKITFIFDEYAIEICLGDKKKMHYCGLPINFTTKGKTVLVNLTDYLISIEQRIRNEYEKVEIKKTK